MPAALLLIFGVISFWLNFPIYVWGIGVIACLYFHWLYPVSKILLKDEYTLLSNKWLTVIWTITIPTLIFISAGIAFIVIDTDWFLETTRLDGELVYIVGCLLAAGATMISLQAETLRISKGNDFNATKLKRNVIRLSFVAIIPWIVLLITLSIFAVLEFHIVIAWSAAFIASYASYHATWRVFFEEASDVVRGIKAGTFEEVENKINKIRSPEDKGLIWGGTILPTSAATGHFLAVGTTGSGKTVTIKLLMESILPKIISKPDNRAIMLDVKRELYAYFIKKKVPETKIHTLNPFDSRSARWNIAQDIQNEAQARELASSLIPPPEREGDNAYFGKAARRIITGIIYSFVLSSDEQEDQGKERIDWRLRDIILAARYSESIKHILNKHSETRYLIKKYFQNEKTANDVLSTLDADLSNFNVVAALWEHSFYSISLKEWATKKKGSILLFGWDEEYKESLSPINRVMFGLLANIVMKQPNSSDRRTWFFLDEFAVISRGLPKLRELINTGREKGACCVLGVIDISGLMNALGENNAKEMTGLCDNVAGLRVRSPETAEWLSTMFGEAELREYTNTTTPQGQSTSEQINQRKTFLSSEFQKIEKPSPENSFTISGYYLNGYTLPYKKDLTGSEWMPYVPKISEEELNKNGIIERPRKQQKLQLWTKNDLVRLGLEIDLSILYEQEQEREQRPLLSEEERLRIEERLSNLDNENDFGIAANE